MRKFGLALGVVAAASLTAACQDDPEREGEGDVAYGVCPATTQRPLGLVLAGSGSMLALAESVAVLYRQEFPTDTITVAPSIGSSGAMRALRDGAIDVGLLSRALSPEETAGLVQTPVAQVPVVFVVADGTPVPDDLDASFLVSVFAGERRTWPDGRPIVPLLREDGDSGEAAVSHMLPAVGAIMASARKADRWQVVTTDQQMLEGLLTIPGALGHLDLGTLRLRHVPLRPLGLRGMVKTLSVVTRVPGNQASDRLLALLQGPAVRALLHQHDFVPLTPRSP